MKRKSKSPWLVPDPMPVRIRDWYYRNVLCKVLGHKEQQKMYDVICRRCSIVLRSSR